MKLYDPNRPFQIETLVENVRKLTLETAACFNCHVMKPESAVQVTGFFPQVKSRNIVIKLHFKSAVGLNDGDIICAAAKDFEYPYESPAYIPSKGEPRAYLMFDVAEVPGKPNLWLAHATSNIPSIGVGHPLIYTSDNKAIIAQTAESTSFISKLKTGEWSPSQS